jgi:hypothetical protein
MGGLRTLIAVSMILVNLALIGVASGHPGGTDSYGCHHCRTNCPAWGYNYGEYHCHGGTSPPTSPPSTPPPAPSVNEGPSAAIVAEIISRFIVELDGLNSDDSDGYVATWDWVIVGPDDITWTNRHGRWTFEAPTTGDFEVSLTVADGEGAQDTSTWSWTIENQPPVVNVTAAQINTTIELDASLSTDPDGDRMDIHWHVNGSDVASGTHAIYAPRLSGIYEVQAVVVDEFGATNQSSTMVAFLGPPEPGLMISGPRATTVNESQTWHIDAWDYAGLPVNVTWTIAKLGVSGNGTNVTVNIGTAGTVRLYVSATNSLGNTTHATYDVAVTAEDSSSEYGGGSGKRDTSLDALLPLAALVAALLWARKRPE